MLETTKIIVNNEIIELKNDCYRIWYRHNNSNEWLIWAEYKYSDETQFACELAERIMNIIDSVKQMDNFPTV